MVCGAFSLADDKRLPKERMYLKHIVELYAKPEDELGTLEKESVLRTHSLHRLIRYLKEKMGLKIQEHTEECLKKIAVFFTARMEPGDNSFLLSEEDIEDAWEAVLQTKGFVEDVIWTMECI